MSEISKLAHPLTWCTPVRCTNTHSNALYNSPRQARRVAVLLVEVTALENLPDDIDASAVFLFVGGIDADPRVQALVSGIDQDRHTKPYRSAGYGAARPAQRRSRTVA